MNEPPPPPSGARKPDFRFKFFNKKTEESGHIGAAWFNENGSISLVLEPKVMLVQRRDEVLTLFPTEDFRKRFAAKKD